MIPAPKQQQRSFSFSSCSHIFSSSLSFEWELLPSSAFAAAFLLNCVFCCKTRESQSVGGARFWCLKDLCFEFIWKQQPGCQKSFITAHIWIFLPSAVHSQLQKVFILVLWVAPPHAHHPARHARLIPESSLFPSAWSRLVYLGLFSSFPSPAGSTWTPFRQNGACLPP